MTQGVYFLRLHDGTIKVGASKQVEARWRNLQYEHGPMTMVGFIDVEGDRRRLMRMEGLVHAFLSLRRLGHWGCGHKELYSSDALDDGFLAKMHHMCRDHKEYTVYSAIECVLIRATICHKKIPV